MVHEFLFFEQRADALKAADLVAGMENDAVWVNLKVREAALFQAAVQLAGVERVAFLNSACHDDPALRQRLEARLAAHAAAPNPLRTPADVQPTQARGISDGYLGLYKEEDFAVNIDVLAARGQPGTYLEIKSRTWSRKDGEHKAALIGELLQLFSVEESALVKQEYVEL